MTDNDGIMHHYERPWPRATDNNDIVNRLREDSVFVDDSILRLAADEIVELRLERDAWKLMAKALGREISLRLDEDDKPDEEPEPFVPTYREPIPPVPDPLGQRWWDRWTGR